MVWTAVLFRGMQAAQTVLTSMGALFLSCPSCCGTKVSHPELMPVGVQSMPELQRCMHELPDTLHTCCRAATRSLSSQTRVR